MHLKAGKKRTGFFYRKKIFFSSAFRERIAARKQQAEEWNVDNDKKVIHGILSSLEKKMIADHLPFIFEVSSTSI